MKTALLATIAAIISTLSAQGVYAAGPGDCRTLLTGPVPNLNYRIWNPGKSSTRYKLLLEHAAFRMGMALIDQSLLSHQHAEAEIYYFLGGKGTTHLGHPGKEQKIRVGAGTFLYIPSGVPHYTVAEAGEPLELLYVFPRKGLDEIEYVYDGSLASFEKEIVVGDLAAFDKSFPTSLNYAKRETLVSDSDLLFDRAVLPARKDLIGREDFPTVIFVHRGRGNVRVGLQSKKLAAGEYFLIPARAPYRISNSSKGKLEVFLFKNNLR